MNFTETKPTPLGTGRCPPDDVLAALMTGSVSLQEVDKLFEHINSCALCETKLDSIGPAKFESELKPIIKEFDRDADRETDNSQAQDTHWWKGNDVDSPNASSQGFVVPRQIDKYQIVEEISHGAFGVVCKAYDPVLDRNVAIKIPRPDRFESTEMVEEFIAEARTTAGLDHRHIVPIYDANTTEDGLVYIVMKWIDGESLQARATRTFSVDETCRLMSQICEAVHYAHQQGFVHRDLKPANILIDQAGEPFVSDFGLALHEDNLAGRRGEFAGTLAYMSPEQIRGTVDIIDGRTDVWSLGVILYELLAGRRPFVGRNEDLATQILEKPPTSIRLHNEDVSDELERVCFQALEKKCESRINSAQKFAQSLPKFVRRVELKIGYYRQYWTVAACLLFVCVLGFNYFSTEKKIWILDELVASETTTYFEENGSLFLTATERTFLNLGDIKNPNFDLSMTISQVSWEGQIGFYFGLDDDNFELLLLNRPHRDSFHLKRMHCNYLFSPASYRSKSSFSPNLIELIDSETLTISIAVRGNKLIKILVNDQEIPDLLKSNLPESSLGRFGIYGNKSTGQFLNFDIQTF